MPHHDITQLPSGSCDPALADSESLSANDRMELQELLHRVYLCEDSRDYASLRSILTSDYINTHTLLGTTRGADAFIDWLRENPFGFDGIRHHCLNAVSRPLDKDTAQTVSYILVTEVFPARSRDETPSEDLERKLPRIIGQGVVVDDWIRKKGRWRLKHRRYDQMSVNAGFLADKEARERASLTTDESRVA